MMTSTRESTKEKSPPTIETRDMPTGEVLYKGHGVTPIRQAQPDDPDYPRGADPTTVVLVQDFKGMHHSVSVYELEPPMEPYPPPPEPDQEPEKSATPPGASGASGASGP
jgi:hypothetical protein